MIAPHPLNCYPLDIDPCYGNQFSNLSELKATFEIYKVFLFRILYLIDKLRIINFFTCGFLLKDASKTMSVSRVFGSRFSYCT